MLHHLQRDLLRLTLVSIAISILALPGCRSVSIGMDTSTPNQQVGPLVENSIPAEPSPTPVVVLADLHTTPTRPILTAVPSLPPDPLRFTFPTSLAEPISLWRPPLYPVPWEPTPYDHFYFIRPIGANEVNWPLARYRYGGVFYAEPHTGIDIPAPKGTPILAAGPGEVIWSGYGLYFLRNEYKDPYGIAVAIRHDFGYQGKILYTVYGHMDESYVWRGQRLQSGEIIGRVGETGKVSGPHLHFEVRLGDNVVFGTRNPELWISPPQGYGIMVGRIMDSDGRLIYKQKVILVSHATARTFDVMTYGQGAVNSDAYYKENVVLGDLPAGFYTVFLVLEYISVKTNIEIKPGMITYYTFGGKQGFNFDPPPPPTDEFYPTGLTSTIPLDR